MAAFFLFASLGVIRRAAGAPGPDRGCGARGRPRRRARCVQPAGAQPAGRWIDLKAACLSLDLARCEGAAPMGGGVALGQGAALSAVGPEPRLSITASAVVVGAGDVLCE